MRYGARALDRLPWPGCAVCNKPVSSLVAYDNPEQMSRTFIAICHGQREKVVVHEETVQDSGPGGVYFGKAFVRPALEPVPAQPLLGAIPE